MFKWEKVDPQAPTERADFIVQWLLNLVSERFKQGRGALRIAGKGYCCLGVGCETAKLESHPDENNGEYTFSLNGEYESDNMPNDLEDFMGLCCDGSLMGSVHNPKFPVQSLVYLNDSKRASFRTIAKTIRSNLDCYFRDLTEVERSYILGVEIPTRSAVREQRRLRRLGSTQSQTQEIKNSKA